MNAKPAHRICISKVKGTYRATCVCGRNLGKFDSEAEAIKRYRQHAGIKER